MNTSRKKCVFGLSLLGGRLAAGLDGETALGVPALAALCGEGEGFGEVGWGI